MLIYQKLEILFLSGIVRKLLKLSFLGETRESDALILADVKATNLSSDVSKS